MRILTSTEQTLYGVRMDHGILILQLFIFKAWNSLLIQPSLVTRGLGMTGICIYRLGLELSHEI